MTEIEGSNYDTTIKAENIETSFTIEKKSNENDKTVQVTSINLKESTTIEKGKTESLVATVNPSNATNKNLIWNSSNTNVATVNNGIVTGVSTGTATITATSVSNTNVTATCKVTVVSSVNDTSSENNSNNSQNSTNSENSNSNNNQNNNNNNSTNSNSNNSNNNQNSTNSSQKSNISNIKQEEVPSGNIPETGKKNTILLMCAGLIIMSIYFYIKMRKLNF